VSASFTVDFVVHRSGDIGSPRVNGSTNASNTAHTAGSLRSAAGRPAPLARTRPSATSPASSSATPLPTMSAEAPIAAPTSLIPPRPSWRAPAPANTRRARSSKIGAASANTPANAAANAPPNPADFLTAATASVISAKGED